MEQRASFPPLQALLARLATRAGPPSERRISSAGAEVLALPCQHSVTYLLLGDEGVVIVDVGSSADEAMIRGALERLGRSAAEVLYIVASHLHFDHVLGIDALARKLGVGVALSRPAYEHVVSAQKLRFPGGEALLRPLATWPMQGLPLPTPRDFLKTLDFGVPWGKDRFRAPLGPILDHGEPLPAMEGWTALLTPGHADDALALHHARGGVLVVGDTIRNFYGGEWNPLIVSVDDHHRTRALLEALPGVSLVCPGHGPIVEGEGVLRRLFVLPPFLP